MAANAKTEAPGTTSRLRTLTAEATHRLVDAPTCEGVFSIGPCGFQRPGVGQKMAFVVLRECVLPLRPVDGHFAIAIASDRLHKIDLSIGADHQSVEKSRRLQYFQSCHRNE